MDFYIGEDLTGMDFTKGRGIDEWQRLGLIDMLTNRHSFIADPSSA